MVYEILHQTWVQPKFWLKSTNFQCKQLKKYYFIGYGLHVVHVILIRSQCIFYEKFGQTQIQIRYLHYLVGSGFGPTHFSGVQSIDTPNLVPFTELDSLTSQVQVQVMHIQSKHKPCSQLAKRGFEMCVCLQNF